MANRSGYQPLSQSVEEEADVGEGVQPSPSTRRLSRRLRAPRRGSIDLSKLDNAFKRQAPSERLRGVSK
jgi:phosphatidylinositol 4-kinase type 2